MGNTHKIYTPRASLCALGTHLQHQHMFDDFQRLPLPQKNDLACAMGEIT
jgi:hypothetical protein